MTPTPDQRPEPRFPSVSRRAFLHRSAFVGLAAASVPVLAACGGSASTAPTTTSSEKTGEATTSTGAEPTAADGTASSTAPTSTSEAGPILPEGAQVQVNFIYEASGGGRVHSPYIAVWIEDPAGDLVQTVSLWYKSDEQKYLRDLKRWKSKNNSEALTTGATRIPGAYSVAWDGTTLDENRVAEGDYFVCIEAVREDGPYQLIRETVPISAALVPTTLAPSGELTAASVELIA